MVRRLLTTLLWLLIIGSVIPVALRALMALPIILIFGHDSPYTTTLDYLGDVAAMPAAIVAMLVVGKAALWLWKRPRGQYASFPIAFGLGTFAYFFWNGFSPH